MGSGEPSGTLPQVPRGMQGRGWPAARRPPPALFHGGGSLQWLRMSWTEQDPPRLPPAVDEVALVLTAEDGVRLEGRLHRPARARGAAVLCHPHPPQGGTMDNKVVVACTRALAAAGLCTLRFNFRGVGQSEGAHSGGAAEVADVRAALAALAVELGEREGAAAPVLLGYSFGSMMAAAAVTAGARVSQLLLVGPPLGLRPRLPRATADAPSPPLPAGGLRVLLGDGDALCPLDEARRFVASYDDARARLTIIEGADHFFHGRLGPLARAVHGAVAP